MTKLSKSQLKDLEQKTEAVSFAFQDLQSACDAYNDAKGKDPTKAAVEAAIAAHNEALSALRGECETIAGEIREFIDSKSEKWQEGDKGSTYECWAEEWEQDLDDISWSNIENDADVIDGVNMLDLESIEDYGEAVNNYSREIR